MSESKGPEKQVQIVEKELKAAEEEQAPAPVSQVAQAPEPAAESNAAAPNGDIAEIWAHISNNETAIKQVSENVKASIEFSKNLMERLQTVDGNVRSNAAEIKALKAALEEKTREEAAKISGTQDKKKASLTANLITLGIGVAVLGGTGYYLFKRRKGAKVAVVK